jgi:hypothetical protein
MILKYCDSNTNSVCLQEIYKVSQLSLDDEKGDKTWTVYFFTTNLMERIDVYVPHFSRGVELMNEIYETGKLDITHCTDCAVDVLDCSTALEELYGYMGDDTDTDDMDYIDPEDLNSFLS